MKTGQYDKALGYAISEVLSDWDDSLTNQRIWQAVFDEDWDKVTFAEVFEDWNGNDLADHIESIAGLLIRFHNTETENIKHSLMDAFLGKDKK